MATAVPRATAQARLPHNAGFCRKRGTDPLLNFAGLGVARPAFGLTGYYAPIVAGDLRGEVMLDPAGGENQGRSGRQMTSASSLK